jgi:hypothetical protein
MRIAEVRDMSKKRMLQSGMILGLILALTGLDWSYGAAAAEQKPDQAMRAFIDAVVRKDKAAILSSFSPTSPWKYVGHEIGTGKVIATKTVSYQTMANDFAAKKGWYHFFFDEPNGYTFRINFRKGEMWKKKGGTTFVCPQSDSGKTYVSWKQEGGKWVIEKIGETGP